jgi:hypothetical protein
MKDFWNSTIACIVCSLCLIFIAFPAYAYVDPNAAGLISQILAPLIIALAAGATFLRKQVGAVFAGLSHPLRRQADA